jgi:DNA ligase-1
MLEQELCRDLEHLRGELDRIDALGGEGLMLREPGSRYAAGRSSTLLKIKRFQDAEARVVEHLPGAGRHKGRLGALSVELPDGTQFSVGTGFSDVQRQDPPPIGSLITFRYQELSDRGVPRFPSFVRVRRDVDDAATGSQDIGDVANHTSPEPDSAASPKLQTSSSVPAMPRRFEFVDAESAKFWEISASGAEVTLRYGRIGTQGQTKTKSLADAAAARQYAAKLIAEKTGKGYAEKSSA